MKPRVVIVGGGFAGLAAARAMARAPVAITLIDRRNYHLFQPLLYQVATASLSPADIAAPIRNVLRRQRNCEVTLAEVVGLDLERRIVRVRDASADGVEASNAREVPYDYLVVATGATHSYFGRDDWATWAPGLKDIGDATEIRRRFLMAFERAELEPDASARRALLTFVVVGAGPTGVELAGAMSEIARKSMPRDFRRIDTTSARIILCEGQERVLPEYPASLSQRALHDLRALGVETLLGTTVTAVDERGVLARTNGVEQRIDASCVFWAAGVKASPLGAMLSADVDRVGRVRVEADLSVAGHPEVFVLGDLAATREKAPGIAPAAMQMGRFAGRLIASEAQRALQSADRPQRPAFRYRDKGMLATIGRSRAVADIRGHRFAGFPAWALWLGVHIFFVIGFRSRSLVLLQWAWAWFTFQRGARLITGDIHRSAS